MADHRQMVLQLITQAKVSQAWSIGLCVSKQRFNGPCVRGLMLNLYIQIQDSNSDFTAYGPVLYIVSQMKVFS